MQRASRGPLDMSSPTRTPERSFWLIVGLLFLVCLLNYFDRQTLSVLKTTLKTSLGFDDISYSRLLLAFMLPYITMYVASGWVIDRFGTRVTMTVVVALWSIASFLAGISHTFAQLVGARALLGAAEPVTFPLAQRIVLNWAPERRRAFALSLISPAGSVGAVVAPLLISFLALTYSWRVAFVVPGAIGLLVAVMWWRLDRLPASAAEPAKVADDPLPLRTLLRSRDFWGLAAARVLSDPVWYFLLFWIPGFLQERRALSLAQVGLVGGLPYLAALVVCLAFGRIVDLRVARGAEAARVQLWLMTGGAALMPLAAIVTSAPNLFVAMAIITVLTAVAQSWFAATGVLLASRIPHRLNTSAYGFIGAIGTSAGLALNLAAGSIIERFGYQAIFAVLALMHPLGAIILWSTLGRRRNIRGWASENAVGERGTPS
jgi:ACS family hexuronate transporter-like MFS transporter